MNASSSAKWKIYAAPSIILIISFVAIFILGSETRKIRRGEHLFSRMFHSPSDLVQIIGYGEDVDIFRRGDYVIIFQTSGPSLTNLLRENGFSISNLDANARLWRPDLCNGVIARLTHYKVQITDSNTFYARNDNARFTSGVIYLPEKSNGVFLGFGTLDK